MQLNPIVKSRMPRVRWEYDSWAVHLMRKPCFCLKEYNIYIIDLPRYSLYFLLVLPVRNGIWEYPGSFASLIILQYHPAQTRARSSGKVSLQLQQAAPVLNRSTLLADHAAN